MSLDFFSKIKRVYVVVFALFMLFVFVYMCPIFLAKQSVKSALLDPDSVQFTNVRYGKLRELIICGEANAKNTFGGYVGKKKFVFDIKLNKHFFSEESPEYIKFQKELAAHFMSIPSLLTTKEKEKAYHNAMAASVEVNKELANGLFEMSYGSKCD